MPRLLVNLANIRRNAKAICALGEKHGISVAGVVKGACGNEKVARVLLESGCAQLASSRLTQLEALRRQLELRGEESKSKLMYHRMLLEGRLPYTVGGGIGQSRLCMFLLRKAHIGEIQSSVWPEEMVEQWYVRRIAEDPQGDYHMERAALKRALAHFEALGMDGVPCPGG